MKKVILYFVALFSVLNFELVAQHQDKNWYFGTGTDGIVFDINNNPVKVSNKYPGVGYEGMVVVSDPWTGALLFYTDGIQVINKNHNVMSNGNGLLANYSGSQCVQACKMPGECEKYYVISNSAVDNAPGSFYSSIVDFTSNPLGQVTNKNQYINGANYHQAMRIIPKANSNNYWLIGHLYNTATYHVFEITPAGFIGPVIYTFSNWGRSWAMEYNINTHKLINLGEDNLKATIFDFDAATGVLSNEIQLAPSSITAVRVGNFSPDGSKIYAGANPGFSLWQYDLSTSVWTNMNTCCYAHDVKTGPNGITYFMHSYYGSNPLSQMTDANLTAIGNACGYSTITNPGNFNGEVRRFPEFLVAADPPIANLDTLTIGSGDSALISVLINDSDPQSDPITLDSILSGPSMGTALIIGNQVFYVPNPGICSGIDSLTYLISDDHCSYDTALIIINIVSGSSNASFSFSNNICAGNVVTFTNTSSNATNYLWNFGDTSTSTLTNPSHIYSNPGTYVVTLIASSSACAADTIQQTITIIPNLPVQANFSYNTTACSYTVSFLNQSVNGTNYQWLFGDGNSSNLFSPIHTYPAPGNYIIVLIVQNACDTDSVSINITLNPFVLPQAAFTYTIDTCALIISFTNFSTGATNYQWFFGDSDSSILNNPVHNYASGGVYNVMLISSNQCGTDTLQQQITLSAVNPVQSAFSFVIQPCGLSVSFTNQSQNGTSCQWSFGDGSPISTITNPTHIYTGNGTYTVTLFASNACSSDTVQQQVTINIPQPAVASFTINTQPCDLTASFINQSQNATTWQWNFGDGTNSALQNPAHTFSTPGIYNITLIVSNSCSSDTIQQQVDLSHAALPQSDFEFSTQPCDLTLSLTNQSQYADSLLWDFGDGTTDTAFVPIHFYQNNGIYFISLVTYNQCGTDTLIKAVVDTFSKGIALFDIEQQPCNSEVKFINQSQHAFGYFWNFGDGNSDTAKNPVHEYLFSGNYTITLIINEGTLCADTIIKTETINNSDTSNLFVPNCFTPNGDSKNEVLKITGFNECEVYHLSIYNRWGQSVYETDDINKFWDGKFKNSDVPQGIYYFILTGKQFSKNGTITVLR